MLLGPLFQNLSVLHHAEHMANVPNKRIDRYRMPLLRNGQRVWVGIEEYDTKHGTVDWPDDYFVTIAKEYLAASSDRRGSVGAADSYFFDAASLVRFGIRWMEEHFNTRDGGLGRPH